MVTIDFSAFVPDSRGDRLESWETRRVTNSDRVRLYLRGPDEVQQQVFWLLQKQRRNPTRLALRDQDRSDWTHRLEFDGPMSVELKELLGLLQSILTLTRRPELHIALALDFYTVPQEDTDPQQWPKTTAGSLVRSAKHRGSASAYEALTERLAAAVRAHDLYAGADVVLTVPGHKCGRASFGVVLARAVAQAIGKPILETGCSLDERPEAKAGGSTEELEKVFSVDPSVAGRVALIVDDVYRTGRSMGAVAACARHMGARGVLGLAGARTLRN